MYLLKYSEVNRPYFEALVNQVGILAATSDYQLFAVGMAHEIRYYLSLAFREGFAMCGFSPNEISPVEEQELQNIINNEMFYIVRLANTVIDLRNSNTLLSKIYPRLDVWSNRYMDVRNRAQLLACGDQKLEWVLGPTEEHCPSCSALSGKVKRASFWTQANIHPQSPPNPNLACGGWNCACQLRPTTAPLSRGPLPQLALQAHIN